MDQLHTLIRRHVTIKCCVLEESQSAFSTTELLKDSIFTRRNGSIIDVAFCFVYGGDAVAQGNTGTREPRAGRISAARGAPCWSSLDLLRNENGETRRRKHSNQMKN